MTRDQLLQADNTEIFEIVKKLHIAYKLKTVIRYGGQRDQSLHSESVAEHIFALLFLAQYFLPLEDPDNEFDIGKVYKMILYHDFGEIFSGDIPYHRKTKKDQKEEEEGAKKVFESLPKPLDLEALNTWLEFEKLESRESIFVNAIDKLEPALELLDPVGNTSAKRLKFTYKDHIEVKLKSTEDFPVIRKFVNAISEELKARDTFWEE